MKPFLAIVKLTFRHALRSHVFQLLLALLVLAVVFIPGTVGAGTAADFIRISLFYSLGTLTFILSLSSMWLGCYAMTHDVESYQLHLVVTKPVSRVTVWMGKWIGVTLVNLLLLLLAAAAIYGIVLYRFGKGDLSVNAFYHYDNFNYFGRMTDWWPATDSTQSINEFRIDVGWTGPFKEKEGLNYSFHAIYNYFGFSKDVFDPVQGNSENHLRLSLNGDYASSEVSHVGVDLDFDFVNYNIHHYMTGALGDSSSVGHENLGVLSVMPYYAYRSNRMSFKLGVNLDVSFNDGAVFRFAPHAEFRYDLLRGLQFYAEADGGKQVNTLSRMFSTNRYMSPRTLPVNSYIPVDVVGGFKVGPFGGFNATIYGGWSKVVDAMMPTLVETPDPANAANPVNTYNRSISQYAVHDMKGWRVGGELAYAFRTIADASVSLTYSPQEENKGYILGDDRAELVLDTKVAFRPIKDLSIMVGYQYRSGRSLIYTSNSGQWLKQDLQDVNFLMLGANYRLNDIVGFFLEFDNILNKRWDTHYGMGTQPIGIIGGVSLLF